MTKQAEIDELKAAVVAAEATIAHLRQREAQLEKESRDWHSASERATRDANREADNARATQRRIDGAKLLIDSRLTVVHEKSITSTGGEFFRGQWVPADDSEPVRFLRDLYEKLSNNVPF